MLEQRETQETTTLRVLRMCQGSYSHRDRASWISSDANSEDTLPPTTTTTITINNRFDTRLSNQKFRASTVISIIMVFICIFRFLLCYFYIGYLIKKILFSSNITRRVLNPFLSTRICDSIYLFFLIFSFMWTDSLYFI